MLQLELDPKYMLGSASAEEIDARRTNILRTRVYIKGGPHHRYRKYRPVSLDEALQTLTNISHEYFQELSDDAGNNIDQWVGKALSKALPFLQGVKGNFKSLSHFNNTMFQDITFHLAVDRHRRITGQTYDSKEADSLPDKQLRESRRVSFQPSLFRLRDDQSQEEQLLAQLIEDINNPDEVLKSDYFRNSPSYRQRALELKFQNPGLSYNGIVEVLKSENLGEFNESAVRVWVLRFRRKQELLQSTA